MPDYTLQQIEQLPDSVQVRYRDMGDGTHALVMAIGGTVVTTGSTAITPTHTERLINGDTVVLVADATRRYALFINDSDTVIYLNLGGASAVNQGIRLNANGGSYEMSAQCGNLYTGAVNANHGGGAVDKLLLVTTGV